MELQEYFDQLAPNWDMELVPEKLERLEYIVRGLHIEPGYCVLDVGTGTGVLLPFLIAELHGEGRIIALDLSAKMLARARAKNSAPVVDFVQADVVATPLADACVDIAVCNGVFPHFSDKVKALNEIARILKDNGVLVICHTMSRAMLNDLHQSIGGIVAMDLLPDESEMRQMIALAGFALVHFEDTSHRYLVIARKRPL